MSSLTSGLQGMSSAWTSDAEIRNILPEKEKTFSSSIKTEGLSLSPRTELLRFCMLADQVISNGGNDSYRIIKNHFVSIEKRTIVVERLQSEKQLIKLFKTLEKRGLLSPLPQSIRQKVPSPAQRIPCDFCVLFQEQIEAQKAVQEDLKRLEEI